MPRPLCSVWLPCANRVHASPAARIGPFPPSSPISTWLGCPGINGECEQSVRILERVARCAAGLEDMVCDGFHIRPHELEAGSSAEGGIREVAGRDPIPFADGSKNRPASSDGIYLAGEIYWRAGRLAEPAKLVQFSEDYVKRIYGPPRIRLRGLMHSFWSVLCNAAWVSMIRRGKTRVSCSKRQLAWDNRPASCALSRYWWKSIQLRAKAQVIPVRIG